MTIVELRRLAGYLRATSAEFLVEAPKEPNPETTAKIRELSAQHLRWAEQLESLAHAFETIADLTRPAQ